MTLLIIVIIISVSGPYADLSICGVIHIHTILMLMFIFISFNYYPYLLYTLYCHFIHDSFHSVGLVLVFYQDKEQKDSVVLRRLFTTMK